MKFLRQPIHRKDFLDEFSDSLLQRLKGNSISDLLVFTNVMEYLDSKKLLVNFIINVMCDVYPLITRYLSLRLTSPTFCLIDAFRWNRSPEGNSVWKDVMCRHRCW